MSSPSAPLRAKLREIALETILDAAERCMSENGYGKTTMQEIATHAGCAIGTFYLYFKSKDQVLQAIVRRHWAKLYQNMQAVRFDADDPVAQLRFRVQQFIQYGNDHRGFFKLFLEAIPARHERMRGHLGDATWNEHQQLVMEDTQAIRRAQQLGKMRADVAAEFIEDCIIAMCMSMHEYAIALPITPSVNEQMDMLWKLIAGAAGIKE